MSETSSAGYTREVSPEDGGVRLDVFLAKQPEVASRTAAKEMVQQGHVEVDGARCKPGIGLSPGQTVTFRLVEPPAPSPSEPAPELGLLHEDRYLVVIDKPAGLAVHPPNAAQSRGVFVTTLAARRWGALPVAGGADRPGIVHRLDKDTSGVMALARTTEAFHFLQSQFKARTVRKEYRALCIGDVRFDSDYIEGNIGVDPRRPERMAVVPHGGREATTYYEVIERFGDFTYVRCLPRTGRTHQIRVHMASIGHPLIADRTYRGRNSGQLPAGAPEVTRQCLHAWSLTLLHPRTHEEMVFDAALPADMSRLLRWFQRRG